MEIHPTLDPNADTPLYRQLSLYLQHLIHSGDLPPGDRLPPTRELSAKLGLNRTTVSAAYELLEESGMIKGSVGRGSFVCGPPPNRRRRKTNPIPSTGPDALGAAFSTSTGASRPGIINFSGSRPSENLFPVEEFRACCGEVLATAPDSARSCSSAPPAATNRCAAICSTRAEFARESDDILITNGCQQAARSAAPRARSPRRESGDRRTRLSRPEKSVSRSRRRTDRRPRRRRRH